jgi:hypothetical protein
LFTGHTLLGFSEKEVGRMTMRKFMKLYSHYKNRFDLELMLRAKGVPYAKYEEMLMQEEEWL